MLQRFETLQPLNLIIVSVLLLPMIGSALLFSVLTVGLIVVRGKIFKQRVYMPMLFNLFLAWIPLLSVGIALLLYLASVLNGGSLTWDTLVLLFIWFIFFPNSTYLITEFHHLKDEQGDIPYWFDTIVILSLALCGLILGSFSLLLVHQMLLISLPAFVTWIIFIVYLFLSNIGIYIGRFMRFNSWDVLTHPLKLVAHVAQAFKERSSRRQLLLFSSLFTVFLLMFYIFLYSAVAPVASGLIFAIQHPGVVR